MREKDEGLPNLSAVRNELARRDLARYIDATSAFRLHEWQRVHLCRRLQRLRDEKGARIAVHKPPQFGGSHVISKRFPAWVLGHDPLARVAICCFNLTRAVSFTEVLRNVMLSPVHRGIFPDERGWIPAVSSSQAFSTAARSELNDAQESVTAYGIESGFTGAGADWLIIDDPYASPETAASATINEKTCRFWEDHVQGRINDATNVVLMFHRYHPDDMAGRLIATGKWEHLRFPAFADENEDGSDPTGRRIGELLSPIRSRAFVENIERSNPTMFFGMFQGRPRNPEGAFFRRSDFQILEAHEWPPLDFWARAWDLAMSAKQAADESVGTKGGVGREGQIYLEDQVSFKVEFPDLAPEILKIAKEDGPEVPIGLERPLVGTPVIQDLDRSPEAMLYRIYPIEPGGRGGGPKDLKTRAQVWATRARRGKLFLRRGPWNEAFIQQCLDFRGDGIGHDDKVASVCVLMELLYQLMGGKGEQDEPKANDTWEYFESLGAGGADDEYTPGL